MSTSRRKLEFINFIMSFKCKHSPHSLRLALLNEFSSVQSLSRVQLFETPWIAARQASLSITNSGVYSNSCPSSWWCYPAISSSVVPFSSCPPIPPSIRVFSNELTLRIRWPKYWNFSFNISPSNKHPGLISFRMDWLDLLAVQGTLMSLLQHHSSKASIFWCSAFFIVQLSHPYMTTGKTIALTRWTFVGKVIVSAFNMSGYTYMHNWLTLLYTETCTL